MSHGTLKILNAIMCMMMMSMYQEFGCNNVYHGVLDVEVPLGFFFCILGLVILRFLL